MQLSKKLIVLFLPYHSREAKFLNGKWMKDAILITVGTWFDRQGEINIAEERERKSYIEHCKRKHGWHTIVIC